MTRPSASSPRSVGWGIGVAVAAVVTLGAIGLADAFPDDSSSDVAFRTVQLFFLEVDPVPGRTPWPLDIARFLAPLTVAATAFLALLAVGRRHVVSLAARLVARDRLTIVGVGPVAMVVARAAPARPFAVLILSPHEPVPSAVQFSRRWWPVETGELADERFLRSLRLERSRRIVIATGDDSLNLRALGACRRLLADARPTPELLLEINDPHLWRELHVLAFTEEREGAVLEVFHPPDRVVRAMLSEVARDRDAPMAVAVAAPDDLVVRLALHLATAAREPAPEVHLEIEEDQRARVVSADPWIGPLTAPAPAGTTLEAGLVLGLPEASALAAGAAMARRHPGLGVYVAVPDEVVAGAVSDTPLAAAGLKAVNVDRLAFGTGFLGSSAVELLAEARHELYQTTQLAANETPASNPSLVPWERLPEALRESNRAFARELGPWLARSGLVLRPLTRPPAVQERLLPSEVEELARDEHARWVRAQRAAGWRFTDGDKDAHNKLSPALVDWDDLPDAEREKDRHAVRALPTFLAMLGYELVLGREPDPR